MVCEQTKTDTRFEYQAKEGTTASGRLHILSRTSYLFPACSGGRYWLRRRLEVCVSDSTGAAPVASDSRVDKDQGNFDKVGGNGSDDVIDVLQQPTRRRIAGSVTPRKNKPVRSVLKEEKSSTRATLPQ